MAALVPLGQALRSRPRRHRGITAEEGHHPLTNSGLCSESPAVNQMNKTCRKRKRVTSTDTPAAAEEEEPIADLFNEILLDILLRLPVKSLLRCKSVCKGWRAIITDPFFVRAHLQHSASRCEQDPCLIINPRTIGYPANSSDLCLYQWRQGDSMATLMHDKDIGIEFRCVRCFTQCDGLVLIAAELRLYLFNPATREAIKLPDIDTYRDRRVPHNGEMWAHMVCASMGLDLRTGKHKVVRAFYRFTGPEKTESRTRREMGMEVFTVSGNSNGGGSAWREIKDVLPYPAEKWGTGVTVNGFLFWRIAYDRCDRQCPQGLLRFSLADETFSITRLPDSLGPAIRHDLSSDVLHGELCVSARICKDTVTMWMLPIQEDGDQRRTWEQRYTVYLTCIYRPLALLPGGRMMLFIRNKVCLYDMASAKLTTVCQIDRLKYQGRKSRTRQSIYAYNFHLYTESLVRIGV